MHRLSGYDAQFIYEDSPEEPQHTLKVFFLSAEASARYAFERVKPVLRARLHRVPPLRWRALRVPLDLHHPVWIDAGDLDLDHHVRRIGLAAPGGKRELCEAISEIASVQLDPKKPLWELWMLEGFEGGRVVGLLKLHHAVADGASSKAIIELVFSREPVDSLAFVGPGPTPPLTAEPVPSKWRLLRDALRDIPREIFRELPGLVRATREWRRRVRAAGDLEGAGVNPFRGPRIPFRGPLSRRRIFQFATVPLDRAFEIRAALGCTVNDVVVATVAGALRSYLWERRELPGLPIVGNMPASTRTEEQQFTFGTRVTTGFLPLPTQVVDPIARVREVQAVTSRWKREVALREGAHLEEWFEHLPPFLVKLYPRAVRRLIRFKPELPMGVVVSNVRGPTELLHAGGGPLENLVSVGHVVIGAVLNVTVWSYVDKLNFGLYTCGERVPDLWKIADAIPAAFDELYEAACPAAAQGALYTAGLPAREIA